MRTIIIEIKDGTADYQSISDAVSSIEDGIIILSPLFSFDACALSEEYPDKKLLALGRTDGNECRTTNCSFIELSRRDAFFNAGQWAAAQDKDVFPLFFTGNAEFREEMTAFTDGWAGIKKEDLPSSIEFMKFDDTQAVDDFIMRLENNSECIAAVFAGPQTVTALGRLEGLSCGILSEHLNLWPESQLAVTGTIELGPVKILSDAVNYLSTGSYGNKAVIHAEFILR